MVGAPRMAWRSEGGGWNFFFDVPDPKKPDDVARWTLVRANDDAVILRVIDPEYPAAPAWRIRFRGSDEFTAIPADPSKGTDPIVFRRLGQ